MKLADFKYYVQGYKNCLEADNILEVTPGLELELELKTPNHYLI